MLIFAAIHQPPASRNLSQNQINRQFTHHRHHPRRRSHPPRPPPTPLTTGNRPSPGAAPTRTASAGSTAPWTRPTAEQPTSTAESWHCWPTNEQQPAILTNGKLCPGNPGSSGNRLTCPPTELRTPSTAKPDGCHSGRCASIAVKSSARCPGCPPPSPVNTAGGSTGTAEQACGLTSGAISVSAPQRIPPPVQICLRQRLFWRGWVVPVERGWSRCPGADYPSLVRIRAPVSPRITSAFRSSSKLSQSSPLAPAERANELALERDLRCASRERASTG